jgi:hypothetical protein
MIMKKIIAVSLIFAVIILSACVSNTPPICSNQARVGGMIVDIPIFEIQNAKSNPAYLSGGSFGYQWYNKGSFMDTRQCDALAQ